MDGRNFDELTRRLASGASRRSLLKGLIGGGAAIVAAKASGVSAQKGGKQTAPAPKYDICHATGNNNNPYVKINVSANSLWVTDDPYRVSSTAGHENHTTDFILHSPEEGVACCRDQDCKCSGQCVKAVCDKFQPGNNDEPGGGVCTCEPDPGASCEDGFSCTENDYCGEEIGECISGEPVNANCPSDDIACTDEVCDPDDENADSTTGCVSRPNDDNCGGSSESCSEGATCDPDNESSASDGCVYPTNGESCNDDADACTLDVCSDGECVPDEPDTLDCTGDDACVDGYDEACVEKGCDPVTGCTCEPVEGSCDDGDLCTQTDTCQGGICVGGNRVICSDDRTCFDPGTCISTTGLCSESTLKSGWCYINDMCYERGAENPSNKCERCDPDTSTTDWTDRPDGSNCGGGLTCQTGVCICAANPGAFPLGVSCELSSECCSGCCNLSSGDGNPNVCAMAASRNCEGA